MRLGSDPLVEAEAVETIGAEVDPFLGRIALAMLVEAEELVIRSRDRDVGVRDVPLAL